MALVPDDRGMTAATWRVVGRSFPGPVVLAVWLLVTVAAPLMFFEATHRWEEDPTVAPALWWTVGWHPCSPAGAPGVRVSATPPQRWWRPR
ncbi:hypothetical protein NKG94_15260 [Micromonospora sp. M12]